MLQDAPGVGHFAELRQLAHGQMAELRQLAHLPNRSAFSHALMAALCPTQSISCPAQFQYHVLTVGSPSQPGRLGEGASVQGSIVLAVRPTAIPFASVGIGVSTGTLAAI